MTPTFTRFLFCAVLFSLSSSFAFAQTILQAGDLVIIGVNANNQACSGENAEDLISFVCFKDILPNTIIDISDNGFERLNPGFWGNSEGFIRVQRTNSDTIPAGTTITFKLPGIGGDYGAISPDTSWSFTPQTTLNIPVNLNNGGDQLFFLQGGEWDEGTSVGLNGFSQDASYVGGRILYGFNTATQWLAGINDSQNSGLPDEIASCFNMAPRAVSADFLSYVGDFSPAPQYEWVSRIATPASWQSYGNCSSFQFPPRSIDLDSSSISISCTVCQSCGPIQELVRFNLPDVGGPFTVDYLVGQDTFTAVDLLNGDSLLIQVDTTTRFELIAITDNSGCPTFSSFAEGFLTEILGQLQPNQIDTLRACAIAGDLEARFNLSLADTLIKGLQLGQVLWYADAGLMTLISTPANYFSANGSVFAQIQGGNCLSAAVEVPLVIEAGADVQLSSPLDLCNSDCQDLELSFTGSGPFELLYRFSTQDSSQLDTIRTASNSAILSFCPADFQTSGEPISLILSSLTDNTCTLALDRQIEVYQGGPVTFDYNLSICEGKNVVVNGTVYDEVLSVGTEILSGAASNGCDSIINVALFFNPPVFGDLSGETSICPGASAFLQVNLQGANTYAIRISDGSSDTLFLQNIEDGDQIEVRPDETTTYTLLEVSGDGISCVDKPNSSVTITLSDFTVSLDPISNFNGYEVSCDGSSDGSLIATVTGTGGPFDVRWSTGATAQQIGNLPAGFYQVSVSDIAGCTQILDYTLRAPEALRYTLQIDSAICADEDSRFVLSGISGGVEPYEYALDGVFFNTISAFPVTQNNLAAGNYQFVIQDLNDCQTRATFNLGNAAGLSLDLGPDQTLSSGDSITLSAALNFNPETINWSNVAQDEFITSTQVNVRPIRTTAYTVQARSPEGCLLSDIVTVFVEKRDDYFAPNVFTPDEDGINDTFMLFGGSNVVGFEAFRIFNRWGQLLYQVNSLGPNDPLQGWNGIHQGELMPSGTYIYSALVRYSDGRESVVSGDFLLLR